MSNPSPASERFRVLDGDATKAVLPQCFEGQPEDWWRWNWHLVEFDAAGKAVRVVGSDGGEPEDQLLVRDWQWVHKEMNAIAEQLAAATARAEAAQRERDMYRIRVEQTERERLAACDLIEQFQDASGLCVPAEEKGGDPGGVKPEHVRRFIEGLERDLAAARQERDEWKCEAQALRAKSESIMNLHHQLTEAQHKIEHLKERVRIEAGEGSKRRKKKLEQWKELEAQRDAARQEAEEAKARGARAVEALTWCADSVRAVLAGKPLRDADEMLGFVGSVLADPTGRAAYEYVTKLEAVAKAVREWSQSEPNEHSREERWARTLNALAALSAVRGR